MHSLIRNGFIVVLLVSLGCQPADRELSETAMVTAPPRLRTFDVDALRPRVEAFCGDCHAPPPPSSFPKEAWRFEVERGFDFYVESFREDLDPPPREDVVAYYESLAPEDVRVAPPRSPAADRMALKLQPWRLDASGVEAPAISFLKYLPLADEDSRHLVSCDMRSGELRTVTRSRVPTSDGSSTETEEPAWESRLLASCAFPAHVEPCDLDGNGELELVVAELGSAESGDHTRGAVIWLRPSESGWRQHLLRSGLGRVSDVRPADLDGDGDDDLLVAVFGHVRTGEILLLENVGMEGSVPRFEEHVIDERHGTIHVPVADLNGDGHLDFVALISQEHEVVDAFLNDGQGTFRREPVFQGNDPAFGSSGIQLVDMDADGDLDVLYSNGDTFGSRHLKNYHGIRWLENQGDFPFAAHSLADMVGVQKALAADLDGDGDQDVVAVALMPRNLLANPELAEHDSVVVLRQDAPGTFIRQSLEKGRFYHAGLELADLNGDGTLEIGVGNMHPEHEGARPQLTIWSQPHEAGQP